MKKIAVSAPPRAGKEISELKRRLDRLERVILSMYAAIARARPLVANDSLAAIAMDDAIARAKAAGVTVSL